MEYAKDEIFNIRYNAKKDMLQIKNNKIFSKISKAIRKHKFMTTVVSAFLIFSCLNIIMIFSFFNILQNL